MAPADAVCEGKGFRVPSLRQDAAIGFFVREGMLTFNGPDKIRELAPCREAWGTSEARQMLEHAIETGMGGVYLRLTPEQYRGCGDRRVNQKALFAVMT
jgi:hypothetical protein